MGKPGFDSHPRQDFTCPKCQFTFLNTVKRSFGTHLKWCGKREEHFWSKVDRAAPNGCWLYNGTISFEGYGYVNIGSGVRRKQWQAHRFAWTLLKGPIPAEGLILHTCDIRNCVNPEHLYIGNRQDNMDDKIRRQRDSTAVLTYEQAADIKARLAANTHGLAAQLAKEYGVSPGIISAIKLGKTYGHVLPAASQSKEK